MRSLLLPIFLSLLATLLYPATQYPNAHILFENSKVLLLTAHPDDECMFFAPTLQALTRSIDASSVVGPEVHSLCLSTGDADGLGEIRRDELRRSLGVLGVSPVNSVLLDHPDLRDNITIRWDPALIADILADYVNENHITTILTFDGGGISGHPNHISLPEGVKYLLRNHKSMLLRRPPKFLVLMTHPLVIKYSGILSPLQSRIQHGKRRLYSLVLGGIFNAWITPPSRSFESTNTPDFVSISGVREYIFALKAMSNHWSQLVWFRWLYVLFSRYMWVNEWVEVAVEP